MVGAGPCGSALALQLVRQGIRVDLVEALNPHQHLARGEGLMPSGLEALARLGVGEALAGVERRPLQSWDFWLEGRPLFAVAEPMGAGPACSLIDTPGLLEALLGEARRHAALRWHPGRTVTGLRWGASMAEAITPGQHGQPRVTGVQFDDGTCLHADLVLACDGRRSTLRQLAGLELRASDSEVSVLWFVLEGEATAGVERWLAGRFVTLVGEGGSLALFSPAGGGLRLGWLVDHAAEKPGGAGACSDPPPWPERWARISPADLALLWRSLSTAAVGDPVAVSLRPGLTQRWQRGGLLLLGDAAHPMSPLRAQGLNMALRDAVVAAAALLPLLQPGVWAGLAAEERQRRLDAALASVERQRTPEILRIQALQQEELNRALLLRRNPWLRRLLAATAAWSGPLLSRRWQAGQPTLRGGLPLG